MSSSVTLPQVVIRLTAIDGIGASVPSSAGVPTILADLNGIHRTINQLTLVIQGQLNTLAKQIQDEIDTTDANVLNGVTISSTEPTPGQTLTATSATAANWQTVSTGGGTVSSGTANHITYYAATGSTVVSDSLLTDNGTTLAYTGTGGITGIVAANIPSLPASIITSGTFSTAQIPASVLEWSAGAFAPGVGTNNQILFRIRLAQAVTFPSSSVGSYGTSTVLATGSTTYAAKKNGTGFATFIFTGGSLEATVAITTTAFIAGDLLEIDGPATADATLANVGITLAGVKQ